MVFGLKISLGISKIRNSISPAIFAICGNQDFEVGMKTRLKETSVVCRHSQRA